MFILLHKLTKYLPRKLPQNQEELKVFKDTLRLAYNINPDDLIKWNTVLSQLTAGKPTSLRRSYGLIANAALKLNVIQTVQAEKHLVMQTLEAKLKEATDKASQEIQGLETHEGQIVS